MAVHHSVFVVGNAGTGKSQVRFFFCVTCCLNKCSAEFVT